MTLVFPVCRFLLILALALCMPCALLNATAQASSTCSAGTSTASMQVCANQRYALASTNLDSTYSKLEHQVSPEARKQLALAQQAWLRFREANALFAAKNAGGTLAPLLRIRTLASMTEARSEELQRQLQ